jgi:fengycin family lipopeptide synthetase D
MTGETTEGEKFPSVIDEVLARATEQPAAIAITWEGQERTYEVLARQIAVYSNRIRASGMEPGARVAVQGPANFETIAAILAAWQEGAVVLLLDPHLPEARQDWMLQVSGVECLLHVRVCLHDPDLSCMRLDDAGEAISIHPPHREGPAYICFTSGSTGKPKGILGQHNGLSHFLDWQRRTFAVGPGDRVAQLTGFSFDVVLRDLFLPLTSGATLCLPPRIFDRMNPWEWLDSAKITRLHAVPSLASHWLDELQASHVCPHIKTTFFAGERKSRIHAMIKKLAPEGLQRQKFQRSKTF